MKKNQVVIYRNFARFMNKGCGLITALDPDDVNWIWVLWQGERDIRRERICDLQAI